MNEVLDLLLFLKEICIDLINFILEAILQNFCKVD